MNLMKKLKYEYNWVIIPDSRLNFRKFLAELIQRKTQIS
jgi:glutaredoxin-related protein